MPLMFLTLATGLMLGVLAPVIAPVIAPVFAGERGRFAWITSALLGMSGALLGGYFGQMLGWYDTGRQAGLLVSVLSAIAILLAYHGFLGRRGSS